MLRIYCLQQWYGLADEALEEALCNSQSLRDFVGIDLSRESVPDATTLLKFRRLGARAIASVDAALTWKVSWRARTMRLSCLSHGPRKCGRRCGQTLAQMRDLALRLRMLVLQLRSEIAPIR